MRSYVSRAVERASQALLYTYQLSYSSLSPINSSVSRVNALPDLISVVRVGLGSPLHLSPRRVGESPSDQNLRGCGRELIQFSDSVSMRKGADRVHPNKLSLPYIPLPNSGEAIAFLVGEGTGEGSII